MQFSWAFQKSVVLVAKKLWAIFRFFFLHRPDFFPPCTLPYNKKNIFFDKNKSTNTKNTTGGRQTPPSSVFRVKTTNLSPISLQPDEVNSLIFQT